MKQVRIVLLTISILSLCGTSILSAQGTGTALVRFGDFSSSEEQVELYWSGLLQDMLFSPNVLTPYMPAEAGEQTFSFALEGATADTSPATETVTIQEGHTYTVVLNSLDQPPYIMDETDDRAVGSDSTVRIIGGGFSGSSFDFRFEPLAPTAIETIGSYEQHMFAFGDWGSVELDVVNTDTEETHLNFPLYILPNTHIVFNGSDPGYINYSTPLSVADLLAQISQMPNPPFSFNHFLETANVGGFSAALAQCENYMWNVWTDQAFESLAPEQQSAVMSNAAVVMDNSVLQQATTTPWTISPTTTRGGTALSYFNPFVTEANPEPVGVGSILLSITTTGSDVQNVINIVDTLPIGDSDVTPSGINYRFHSDIDEAMLGS